MLQRTIFVASDFKRTTFVHRRLRPRNFAYFSPADIAKRPSSLSRGDKRSVWGLKCEKCNVVEITCGRRSFVVTKWSLNGDYIYETMILHFENDSTDKMDFCFRARCCWESLLFILDQKQIVVFHVLNRRGSLCCF